MIRGVSWKSHDMHSWPRTSGDDPLRYRDDIERYRVGPARAGMIRVYRIFAPAQKGWPRTSGDDPGVSLPL